VTAGTVQQNRCLVSFAEEARRHQRVDDPDRTFKGDGMKGDESFFAGIGFDVGKHFLFVVHEKVTGFMHFLFDFWHEYCCVKQLAGWYEPSRLVM